MGGDDSRVDAPVVKQATARKLFVASVGMTVFFGVELGKQATAKAEADPPLREG